MKPLTAAIILANINELEAWRRLVNSKSEDVQFRVMAYLTDRRDGKAQQTIDISAEDSVMARLAAGRQRAAESKTATKAPVPVIEIPTTRPTLRCARHGPFLKPYNAKSDMCPACIADAEREEKKLLAMIPGGMTN
ncbi:MAG TPA: hypothetical protein VMG82_00115 [Candidatus Sulfotelmatobacter sp.]|nr:hypothetical protein [Candidatus Sulfotelmatobacter sp.]